VSIDPSLPEGQGFSGAALREGQHYVVNDFFAHLRIAPWAKQAQAAGVKSMATLPLLKDTRAIGVLNLHGDEVDFFTAELVALLKEMADNLSFGLDNIAREAERERAQRELAESEQKFRQLAANIPEVFWIATPGHERIVYVSPAYERVWGRSAERLLSVSADWLDAVHVEDRERVAVTVHSATDGFFDHEYRIIRPDGTVRWVHERAFPILNEQGALPLVTGIAEDITERKVAEEQLLLLAHYDHLTGLPNRPLFYDRLKQSLAQGHRSSRSVAVVFVDLDHFKIVNDTLGHAAGDRLLQEVAHRLKQTLRASDTVGRLGGDEFAIILADLASSNEAEIVAQKLMHALEHPFEVEGHELFVMASAGIALSAIDGDDADTLIQNADTAMYRAKEMGRSNWQFYKADMNARSLERISLDTDLRRALERNEFVLHYQPKVAVASGMITGMEALVRWEHPELGLVPPGRFIHILEDNGLIVPVGEWVVMEACRQLRFWSKQGVPVVPVALNLSGRQLQQNDLERRIRHIVSEAAIDPRLLELEITESVLMRNPEQAARLLRQLKELGMRLSVDDFGTGYSSLAYLKSFPLDTLKIDRSFVEDVVSSSDDAAIVQAIVALARSLKLTTVAEGVENISQLALLTAVGCNEYQGYYFSAPLVADKMASLLQRNTVVAA
jgi:diguanylate cyclase (GGDEF)-like protein/PAS domain S-box-containing protein